MGRLGNINTFEKNFSHAVSRGLDFDVISSGSIIKIKYYDKRKPDKIVGNHKFMTNERNTTGMHLINMFLADVRARVKAGSYIPKNADNTRIKLQTVAFNPDNIYANLGVECVAVDIVSCYWNTAHNIGLMSDKLYEYAIAEVEQVKEVDGVKQTNKVNRLKLWKDARNISIGALGTCKKVDIYRGGKLVDIKPYTHRDLNICRLDVIDYVWDVCINDIRVKLGEDFLMFLTDCFFVSKSREKDVQDMLGAYNYKTRAKDIVFTDMQQSATGTYKVLWKSDNQVKPHSFNDSNIV